MDRKKLWIALIFLAQILSQVIGAVYYSALPEWFWSIFDALILVTPLIFGLGPGVFCCLPNTAAEVLWFAAKGYMGVLFHGIAFLITVLLEGVLCPGLKKGRLLLFELALVFENALYCLLRQLFLSSSKPQLTMQAVFKTTFSVGNLLCLGLLVFAMWYRVKKRDENKA